MGHIWPHQSSGNFKNLKVRKKQENKFSIFLSLSSFKKKIKFKFKKKKNLFKITQSKMKRENVKWTKVNIIFLKSIKETNLHLSHSIFKK